MSKVDGSRKLLDLLTCPICLEKFQSPRTLPCLHSFCTECLDRCRRPLRHSLDCPVCKRNVLLPTMGVRALQIDHRIQQIEDIFNDHQLEPTLEIPETSVPKDKCNLCKAQKRQPLPDGSKRCDQCNMIFCLECSSKHDANPLFAVHRLQDLSNLTDICSVHVGFSIKYYCKQCQTLLCTACVLEHNTDHEQRPWDRCTVERYKEELTEINQQVSIKIRELKSKKKHLETLKQNHRGSLHEVQSFIRARANEMVRKIKERESKLLDESQTQFDGLHRDMGIDAIGDLNFKQTQIETLHTELESLASDGSLCKCLIVYDSLLAKYRGLILEPHKKSNVHSAFNSSVRSKNSMKMIKFIPSSEDVNFLIGTLQEFSSTDSNDNGSELRRSRSELNSSLDGEDKEVPSSSCNGVMSMDNISDLNYRPHKKRTKLILDAVCQSSPRRELAKIQRRMRSPFSSTNRNHSTEISENNATISQSQDESSAAASGDINPIETGIDDFGNVSAGGSDESAIAELLVDSCVSLGTLYNENHPVQPMDEFCGIHPLTFVSSISSAQSPVRIASSVMRIVEENQAKSSQASLTSIGRPLSSKGIRQYLQIEKIGSLLGNLLPSKSIAFIKGLNTSTLAGPFTGGLFAYLSQPSSPASDWLLVVAETGHRLHVFDSRGSSSRLIGWGNVKPQVVAYSEEGLVYCTDKKDLTVKTFHLTKSWFSTSWQAGMFEHPHGLAITMRGHLVVTDIGKNTVTVHCGVTGRILQRLAHPRETFSKPAYVAVDKTDNVYISDIIKKCIFVFNQNGCFVRMITLPPKQPIESCSSMQASLSSSPIPPTMTGTSLAQPSPYGLAMEPSGRLAICDWENGRILSCAPDGSSFATYEQCSDLFHPINISFDWTGKYFAVVESSHFSDNDCSRINVYEVL